MNGGDIVFSTAIDTKNLEREMKDVSRKMEQATNKKAKATEAKLPLEQQLETLTPKLDEAKAKLAELQKEAERINLGMQPGASPEAFMEAYARKDANAAELQKQTREVEELQKKWDSTVEKVEAYDRNIADADREIEQCTQKAGELREQMESANAGGGLKENFEGINKVIDKATKKLASIAKRIFVFSLITKALSGARSYFSGLLKSNAEFQAQLAKLRAALATAFQPLYEVAVPILIKILSLLTDIASVAANFISILFGKSLKGSAQGAKKLNEEAEAIDAVGGAAKDAQKQLAGFDELNKLSSSDSGGGGGGGATPIPSTDFSDFDTDAYKKKIDELTVYVSGALLALGAILTFTGANIPLGLGLMALGAIGLAKEIAENWGGIDPKLQDAINGVMIILVPAFLAIGALLAFSGVSVPIGLALMAIGAAGLVAIVATNWNAIIEALKGPMAEVVVMLGGVLFAIGALFAFSGVAIPLGIALMAAGAAGLATVTALNWNAVKQTLQGSLGGVVAIASAFLLAIGLVLAFSGVSLPIGLAMIAAGAAGLVTVTALNWDAILEKLKEAWNGIKQWWDTNVAPKLTLAYWQDKFSAISDALKDKIRDGVNTGIALLNQFIAWVNSALHLSWGGLSAFGRTIIPAGSYQLLTIPPIPMLAQGAVIPPNAPFMAMLGDQRSGNNIEAPESLIRQIVREETGGNGAVVSLLRELISVVEGIEVGDDVIGAAATRYQRSQARRMGG